MQPRIRRYAAFDKPGPPSVLEVREEPVQEIREEEILVELIAAGINQFDVKQRAGLMGSDINFGSRTGYDGAGKIVQVGTAVRDWQVGDRVVTRNRIGTVATHLAVKSNNLILLPAAVGYEAGAAAITPPATAYQALRSLSITSGDVVVIHGGSGAVGSAAIQFAFVMGASRVIATCSEARFAHVANLGGEPVRYGTGATDRILATLAGDRVSAVLDVAGAKEAIASIELLGSTKRWATIAAGEAADNLGLTAFGGGSKQQMSPDQYRLRKEGVKLGLDLVANGTFVVEVDGRYPLDHIVDAHEDAELRKHSGRQVILLDR